MIALAAAALGVEDKLYGQVLILPLLPVAVGCAAAVLLVQVLLHGESSESLAAFGCGWTCCCRLAGAGPSTGAYSESLAAFGDGGARGFGVRSARVQHSDCLHWSKAEPEENVCEAVECNFSALVRLGLALSKRGKGLVEVGYCWWSCATTGFPICEQRT